MVMGTSCDVRESIQVHLQLGPVPLGDTGRDPSQASGPIDVEVEAHLARSSSQRDTGRDCSSIPGKRADDYHPQRVSQSSSPRASARPSRRCSRRHSVCTRCQELAATRKNVVFGAGNADAELMFVGEAPGASEDEQGLPFVGRAGKLLETLLKEIGMERKDVFIANVLKCRPPGNRDPLPVEIENCREYLYRQVELIQPRVICSLGNFSTKLLQGRPDRDHPPAR